MDHVPYPQLAEAVRARYLAMSMTGRQMRMAITEPAKKTASKVEDDLVDLRQPGFSSSASRTWVAAGLRGQEVAEKDCEVACQHRPPAPRVRGAGGRSAC